jgi:hypothetical protein
MGVIVTEEYVCDFCSGTIKREEAQVGSLVLRRPGARGLGRSVQVALHEDCVGKLIRFAQPAPVRPKR